MFPALFRGLSSEATRPSVERFPRHKNELRRCLADRRGLRLGGQVFGCPRHALAARAAPAFHP